MQTDLMYDDTALDFEQISRSTYVLANANLKQYYLRRLAQPMRWHRPRGWQELSYLRQCRRRLKCGGLTTGDLITLWGVYAVREGSPSIKLRRSAYPGTDIEQIQRNLLMMVKLDTLYMYWWNFCLFVKG